MANAVDFALPPVSILDGDPPPYRALVIGLKNRKNRSAATYAIVSGIGVAASYTKFNHAASNR
jgi:hypothetical protein